MIEFYHTQQPCDCTVCFHQRRILEMARKEFAEWLDKEIGFGGDILEENALFKLREIEEALEAKE